MQNNQWLYIINKLCTLPVTYILPDHQGNNKILPKLGVERICGDFYVFLLKKTQINKTKSRNILYFLIGRAVNYLLGLHYPKKQSQEFCNMTGKRSTASLWKLGSPNTNETRTETLCKVWFQKT